MAAAQAPAQQQPAFDRRKRRRRLLILFFWWIWVSPERRFYAGAIFFGLLLSIWSVYLALVAQGRLPSPEFRLPNLEDVSLPGRPVLIPVVPFGRTSTANSAPMTSGWLEVNKEDALFGRTFIPSSNGSRSVMLLLTSNLPRLQVTPPPIPNFRSLRLFELDVVETDTQKKVDWRGHDVEIRVEIRPIDLQHAKDTSALFLLHYDTMLNVWEDTRAVVDNGFLVATVNTLSPFAVGFVQVESEVQGERAPTPTPTATAVAVASAPTATVTAAAAATATTQTTGATPTVDANTPPDVGDEPAEEATVVPLPTTPEPAPTAVPPQGTPIISPFVTPTIAIPTSVPIVILVTPAPTPTRTPTPQGSSEPGGGPAPSAPGPAATSTPGIAPVVGLARSGGGSVNGLFNATLAPGGSTSANVILSNDGSVDFTYSLSAATTTSSVLDTNTSQGLQLEVFRCGPSFGGSCTTLVYSGPVIMSNVALGGPQSVGTGGLQNGLHPSSMDYLMFKVTLPTAAANTFRSTQSVLNFTWLATQAP